MNNPNAHNKPSLKRFAWSALALCISCCAVIPILVFLGFASVAGLAVYFELAATGFFIVGIGLFTALLFKHKSILGKTACSCKASAKKR
ncbi:MAG: hypothetical protein ACPG47_06100 [Leucothrix sp.]